MSTATIETITPKVVSPAEWLAARKEFLKKEKELVHLRDELSRQRRELPWERVEKNYIFEGAHGAQSLADLFDGRTQLVVYHLCLAQAGRKVAPAVPFLRTALTV